MPAFGKADQTARGSFEEMMSRKRTREEEHDGSAADDHEFLRKFQEDYQARKKMRKVRQRTAANGRERKRVGRINSGFVLLEAKLHDSQVTQEQCLPKIKTLQCAIDYIHSLTKVLKESDSINQRDSHPSCASPHSFTTASVISRGDHPTCQYESCDDRSFPGDASSDSSNSDIFSSLSLCPLSLTHSLTDLTAPSLHQIWPECVGIFPSAREAVPVPTRPFQPSHIPTYKDPELLTSPFMYRSYQPAIHYC